MADEFTYWLPPSAVKQSGKTMMAEPIAFSCTRRAARSGTFSLKFFHATWASPEPVKPTMSTRTGKRLPRPRLARGDALDRMHEPPRALVLAQVVEHHRGGPEGRDRIGHTLAGDVEGGAVDRLEHRGKLALRIQVRGGRDAEASRKRRGEVREDVGMQVRRHDHVD